MTFSIQEKDQKPLNHSQNGSVSKTKLFGTNFMQIDYKQESYWRLKIEERQAGNQKISEVVTLLTHSGYWFFSNNA